ncbi:MAG TPA: glycosyltransferase family 2 protein [Methylomirabilota bacterium]|nr:glycosyltransferase family 2 protein [Methylomirabilota bacterium]
MELSVVLPCLNEADTLETCIRKAQASMRECGIRGEVVVADNGSTDGSSDIAARCGARVVHVGTKGYGHALMAGIAAARARFVLMADADDSYDLREVPRFLDKAREGYDLVQGCRLPSGGGKVLPGAMRWSHRWLGNPIFSRLSRWWFGASIHDVYCGMRLFDKVYYESLRQRCAGMEFATEMIIKASLYGARIAEVPITLHPDGRRTHPSHLRTVRDGWRTLRFFLMYSPKWLFLVPGTGLILLGLIGYAVALPGARIGRLTFDAHTLLFASLAVLCGYQAILFAIFTKVFAMMEGLIPEDAYAERFFRIVNLERGLVVSGLALGVGLALLLVAVDMWRQADFGRLDYARTMRWVIPGATLTALGFQTVLSGFFVSILGMKRR